MSGTHLELTCLMMQHGRGPPCSAKAQDPQRNRWCAPEDRGHADPAQTDVSGERNTYQGHQACECKTKRWPKKRPQYLRPGIGVAILTCWYWILIHIPNFSYSCSGHCLSAKLIAASEALNRCRNACFSMPASTYGGHASQYEAVDTPCSLCGRATPAWSLRK